MAEKYGYHQLQRAALSFVLESETWPVFLAWARKTHVTQAMHDWLENGPDIEQYRDEWVAHGPDRYIQSLATKPAPGAEDG